MKKCEEWLAIQGGDAMKNERLIVDAIEEIFESIRKRKTKPAIGSLKIEVQKEEIKMWGFQGDGIVVRFRWEVEGEE